MTELDQQVTVYTDLLHPLPILSGVKRERKMHCTKDIDSDNIHRR